MKKAMVIITLCSVPVMYERYPRGFGYNTSFNGYNKFSAVFICIQNLKIRKLRFREFKKVAQDYTSSKLWSQDLEWILSNCRACVFPLG